MKVIGVPLSKAPWFCYCGGVRVHCVWTYTYKYLHMRCVYVHMYALYILYLSVYSTRSNLVYAVPHTLWVLQLCREVALDPSAVLPPGAIWRRVDYPVPFCGRHHSPSFSPCLRHTASAALAPWPRCMRRQLLPPLPRNYSFTTECLNNRLQILCIYVQPFSSYLLWMGTSVPVVKIST